MAGGDITWRASLNDDPFRSAMDKIVGITDQKGKMAVRLMKATGVGMAAGFAIGFKGIDELAKRNDYVRSGLEEAKGAWSGMWAAVGEGAFASGLMADITAGLKAVSRELHGLGGIEQANAFEQNQGMQRENEARLIVEKERLKTMIAQARARKDEVGAAKLEARSTLQSETERINAVAKDKNLPASEARKLIEEAQARYRIAVETADVEDRAREGRAREDFFKGRMEEVNKWMEEADAGEKRYQSLRESLSVEREMLDVQALQRKGMDEAAALLENQINRKKRLKDLDDDEGLSAGDRAMLRDRVNNLFDDKAAGIRDQKMGMKRYDFQPLSALYDNRAYGDLYRQAGGGGGAQVDVRVQTVTLKAIAKTLETIEQNTRDAAGATYQP